MSARAKILVVDDEPVNREIMQEILEPDFDVLYAESGPQCLELVQSSKPGIILLDINMPGMSGYEVCQQLKASENTKTIPVTFVSALDTLAERLAGYEVGGYDYITKPFEPRELLTKVKVALELNETLERNKETASMAMSTAMIAMSSTSELGVVLHFLRETFKCNDLEALGQLVVNTMESYGLSTTVQIRTGKQVINKSTSERVNPLEATVIQRIYQEDRIIDLGNRSIFNYEHVSILAKGMPLDDTDKLGRFKDNLALLAEGAEASVRAIMMQLDLHKQRNGLAKMVQTTRDAMNHAEENHEMLKLKSMRILADLISRLEESYSFLGLTEGQEQQLTNLVNDAVRETIAIYEQNSAVDETLLDTIEGLRDIVGNAE